GRDQTLFWGVGGQTSFRLLRASTWIRSEDVRAARTGYSQQGLSAFARLEYRVRTLNVAAEYRRNFSLLQYAQAFNPDSFRGRQFRLSIIRQFGFRVRSRDASLSRSGPRRHVHLAGRGRSVRPFDRDLRSTGAESPGPVFERP